MEFFENIPAISPPPGVVSNFTDPKTLGPSLIAVNATFLFLMLIAVMIRMYSRGAIVHATGWDDYTCVAGALAAMAHTIMMLWVIHFGYGHHLWDIRAVTLLPSRVRQMDALGIIYVIAIFFTKISICLLYLRIFGVERSFRFNVYGGVFFCAVFYLFFLAWLIATVAICWTPANLGRTVCVEAEIVTLLASVLNVCTDVYLLVLPVRSVLKMRLRQRQRIGLLLVFLSGSVACAVSIARLIYTGVRYHNSDTLYFAALTSELSAVELNVAIITSSLSTMPQFFARLSRRKPSIWSSLKNRLFSPRNAASTHGEADLARGAKTDKRVTAYLELQELPNVHLTGGSAFMNTTTIENGSSTGLTT